jgi:hypothetical protein
MKEILRIYLGIAFLFCSSITLAQQVEISGRVTSDGDAESLPGVNVSVKGTTTGTLTDVDGRYSLRVNAGNTVLVFSYIGFETQEIKVENRRSINYQLLLNFLKDAFD